MKILIVKIIYLIFIIALQFIPSLQYHDKFYEELYIKPIRKGSSAYVNTYFQFSTRWEINENDNLKHTNLFPRAIADIFDQFSLHELHISLTQGQWSYELWGYPFVDAAPGAEIWAWFKDNLSPAEIDEQWRYLSSTLSGILCASLNFVDETNSIEPKYSFRPRYGNISQYFNSNNIRYSLLPREIVCTENLTPWKKLLPCSGTHGLVSLLNSGFIYNSKYNSLAIEVRAIYDNLLSNPRLLEFRESINILYDLKMLGLSSFTIRALFGQGLNGKCPLSSSSIVYAENDNKYKLEPTPKKQLYSVNGNIKKNISIYDIGIESPKKMFNLEYLDMFEEHLNDNSPALFAHRYILREGQERGKLVSKITNTLNEPANIILQENIPWYLPIYLHTLHLEVNSLPVQAKNIHYVPGERRKKPYHLEIACTIPAKSTISIFLDFDFIFLKWIEYPPDASHGFYIGSATISAELPFDNNYLLIPVEGFLVADSLNYSKSNRFLQIRTENLILPLPTPDFSMPYNVICLACTVVALAFGPIHSVATKKMVIQSNNEASSFFQKLRRKLFANKE